MQTAARTFKADLKKALQQAGQPVTVRATEEAYRPLSLYADPSDGYTKMHVSYKARRVVSVRGVNSHQYSNQKMGALDYTLKKFGSPGPASFAWERIPFSFVVDWFLDTKLLFANLDNLLTGSSKSVSQTMVTETVDSVSEMIHLPALYPNSSFYGESVAQATCRYYRRKVLSLLPPSVTKAGRFGKKQAALSAALLYQQIAKR
jgi:hypothetical protein